MKPEIQNLIAYAEDNKKNLIILSNNVFTKGDILILQSKKLIYSKLVEAIEPGEYGVECNCSACGKTSYWTFSKNNLIKHIRNTKINLRLLCEGCYELELQVEQKKNYEYYTKYLLTQEQYYYYKHADWNVLVNNVFDVELVAKKILALEYSDFLKTVYWRCISNYLRREAGKKCVKCGSNKNLCVHHKTYVHHGKEHLFLEDLEVLCGDCHANEHLQQKENKEFNVRQLEEPLHLPRTYEINEETGILEQDYINNYASMDLFDTEIEF